jgi:hypothetical protein
MEGEWHLTDDRSYLTKLTTSALIQRVRIFF